MKTLVEKMVLILLTMTVCISCSASRKTVNSNDGKETSRTYNLKGFKSIRQCGVGTVEIVQTAGDYNVKVSGTKELVNATNISTKDGVLVINQDRTTRINGKAHLYIIINMPQLETLESRGVGCITIAQLNQDKLDIDSRGVGNIKIGRLKCNSLDIDNRGVGNIAISGRATNVTINNRGVGNVNTLELDAENVSADNRGVGNIKCSVSDKFDASSRGVGNIRYKGNPKTKDISHSGLGSIKQI
jgi:hypothetical protein